MPWTAQSTYPVSVSYTLSDTSQGIRTVYAIYRDNVPDTEAPGNTSQSVSDTILLDQIPPTSFTVSLDTGAVYAPDTDVWLDITTTDTDILYMYLWGDVVSGGTLPFSDTSIELTAGDGTKTVWIYLTDGAGQSSSSKSDTIILDTVEPIGPPDTLQVIINGGDLATTNPIVSVEFISTGAVIVYFSELYTGGSLVSPDTLDISGTTVSGSYTFSPGDSAVKTIYAQFADSVPLLSSIAIDTIVLNNVAPLPASNLDNRVDSEGRLYLWWDASPSIDGISYLVYSDSLNPGGGIDYNTVMDITSNTSYVSTFLLNFDTELHFGIRARDGLGNMENNTTVVTTIKVSYLPNVGDFDGDNDIDTDDLNLLLSHLFFKETDVKWEARYNLVKNTEDGLVANDFPDPDNDNFYEYPEIIDGVDVAKFAFYWLYGKK